MNAAHVFLLVIFLSLVGGCYFEQAMDLQRELNCVDNGGTYVKEHNIKKNHCVMP